MALWNHSNGQLEYSQRVVFVTIHQVVLVYQSGQCCGQNSRFTFIMTNKDAEKLSVGYALKSTEKVNKWLDNFGEWCKWHSEYHQPFPAVRKKCALSSARHYTVMTCLSTSYQKDPLYPWNLFLSLTWEWSWTTGKHAEVTITKAFSCVRVGNLKQPNSKALQNTIHGEELLLAGRCCTKN